MLSVASQVRRRRWQRSRAPTAQVKPTTSSVSVLDLLLPLRSLTPNLVGVGGSYTSAPRTSTQNSHVNNNNSSTSASSNASSSSGSISSGGVRQSVGSSVPKGLNVVWDVHCDSTGTRKLRLRSTLQVRPLLAQH